MIMSFGKHKGEYLEDIEVSYLKWLEGQDWLKPDLREAVQFEIERREGDVTSLGKVKKERIVSWSQ